VAFVISSPGAGRAGRSRFPHDIERFRRASDLIVAYRPADITSSIDPATGRGTGFLPIALTPDVGIGNPFLGRGGPRNIQLALKLIF
jgi:hypothetical protein